MFLGFLLLAKEQKRKKKAYPMNTTFPFPPPLFSINREVGKHTRILENTRMKIVPWGFSLHEQVGL